MCDIFRTLAADSFGDKVTHTRHVTKRKLEMFKPLPILLTVKNACKFCWHLY